MLARYAVAIGRGEHRHRLRERSYEAGLPLRFETAGLLLAAAEGTPVLPGRRSILVGQLFSSDHERLNALPCVLDDPLKLEEALGHYWGNFALFHEADERQCAYRDPSGSISVFRCGGPQSSVFVSDADLARPLGLLSGASPDLTYAAHWLQFPFLRTRRTGLHGVSEVLAGVMESSIRSSEWMPKALWRPQTFVPRGRRSHDPQHAAARLRELALKVVPLQACGPMLLRLSGGLDSSVIAACFALAGKQFKGINFATRTSDGDERTYAREVATKYGIELIEVREPRSAELEIPSIASFAPSTNPLLAPFDRALHEAIGETEPLLVDGGGGDNLFCSTSSAAPVLDAIGSGLLPAAATAAADIAERANCTLWQVAGAASRRSLKGKSAWKEDRSFLRKEALLAGPELHPWFQGLRAPPGKRDHVEAIVHIQHFLDRGQGKMRLLHPLLCQPLVELCLAIPSWLWVRGGRDRAVARDAFADLLPKSVAQRRSKGSLQSMFHRSFEQLGPQMLDMLRSGSLASSGLIDVAAVELAFNAGAWKGDEVQLRLSEMVAMELWLRSCASLERIPPGS
jgi:asparagine synthase (glutamine-hydrolysing)